MAEGKDMAPPELPPWGRRERRGHNRDPNLTDDERTAANALVLLKKTIPAPHGHNRDPNLSHLSYDFERPPGWTKRETWSKNKRVRSFSPNEIPKTSWSDEQKMVISEVSGYMPPKSMERDEDRSQNEDDEDEISGYMPSKFMKRDEVGTSQNEVDEVEEDHEEAEEAEARADEAPYNDLDMQDAHTILNEIALPPVSHNLNMQANLNNYPPGYPPSRPPIHKPHENHPPVRWTRIRKLNDHSNPPDHVPTHNRNDYRNPPDYRRYPGPPSGCYVPTVSRLAGNVETVSKCGFGPKTGIPTPWGTGATPRNPNIRPYFRTAIMDIVIFHRLDMDPNQPSPQDARGRLKQASKVRFNTRNLICAQPGCGDMILRVGKLILDNTGRATFRVSPLFKLFELIWRESSTGDLVYDSDSKGRFQWEETTHISNNPYPYDLTPWPWAFFDSRQPVRSGDSSSSMSPRSVYKPDELAKCLVLRRKTDGIHDHDCQKMDWYPVSLPERRYLLHDDFVVRFGVMDLQADPRDENSPDVLCCVELWKFYKHYLKPTDEELVASGSTAPLVVKSELAEFCGWIFLGRDECWMKGEYDIGLKGMKMPHSSRELSQFIPEHEWPSSSHR